MNNKQIDQDAYNAALSTYNAAITAAYNTFTKTVSGLFVPLPTIPPVVTPPIVTPPTGGTTSKPISLSGASNQTISGLTIVGGSAGCITLKNCHDIKITGCNLSGSTSSSGAIYLSNCYNITIDSNYIASSPRLVYAESCPQGGIVVTNNQFYNPLGPVSNSGAGQAVQLNGVGTVSVQNVIANNKIQTLAGNTGGEDKINLYKSNGTAALPILVNGNEIVNGSTSKTGGGIMLGDSGGSHQSADSNILVDPGQYGMAIAGGDSISITNNQIYAKSQPYTNVGLYVWDNGLQWKITNPTVSGNKVTWYAANGSMNSQWLGTGAPTPAGWSTNNWNAGLTSDILKNPLF